MANSWKNRVKFIVRWDWLFDNSYVSSWHPEIFQVHVRLWRKWSSWQKWFWGNAMIKDESYHFDLMAFSWSSKNHFCPQCLAVRNTIMEGKGSWNQEKWVLLNQVYRDWVLVDLTQLLLICDISGTPRIRKWWQIFGTRSQKSQTSTRCCGQLSLLQIPFRFFHIYFHCLSTTFTHSYPLSLSQIAFSLSCINYQFLRSPFTLLRKPPLSHQIVSFLLERWSRHRGVYGGSGDRLQGQKVSSSCKTSLQHQTWIHFFFTLANILNIKYLLLSDTPTFPRLSSSSLRLSSGPSTLMEMGQLVSEKR